MKNKDRDWWNTWIRFRGWNRSMEYGRICFEFCGWKNWIKEPVEKFCRSSYGSSRSFERPPSNTYGLWVGLFILGERRSLECFVFPKPMGLQKGFTIKWKWSQDVPMALGILKTIAWEFECYADKRRNLLKVRLPPLMGKIHASRMSQTLETSRFLFSVSCAGFGFFEAR